MEPKSNATFPRIHRLLKPKEFQDVFQSPIKLANGLFVFFIKPNSVGHARMGVIITKRRFKRAVDRNHIRRMIRESFRNSAIKLSSIDIIVLAQSAIKTTQKNLRNALDLQWINTEKVIAN